VRNANLIFALLDGQRACPSKRSELVHTYL
jgi:hypothetical protein